MNTSAKSSMNESQQKGCSTDIREQPLLFERGPVVARECRRSGFDISQEVGMFENPKVDFNHQTDKSPAVLRVSVFGLGYVGCVSLACLAKNGHFVTGVDISKNKVAKINAGIPTIVEPGIENIIREEVSRGRITATADSWKAVHETELSIITVGTPLKRNGHQDFSSIYKLGQQIGKALAAKDEYHTIVLRSTVVPGTTEKMSAILEKVSGKKPGRDYAVLYQPEFLREGAALHDYENPAFTLIGSNHPLAAEILASLYRHLPAEILHTEIRVAELLKYVNNSFHALKISFANEIGNICKALDIDTHAVMDIFCQDKKLNLSSSYLRPGFAYGGSCLPKDLRQLQALAHDRYLKTPVLSSIDLSNDLQIERAAEMIASFNKRRIGFLGLSFKAQTDDLRNSPAVKLVETFLGKGYQVSIYDTCVRMSRITGANKEFLEAHIPHVSSLLKEKIGQVIEESDVLVMVNKEGEYIQGLKNANVCKKLILDMVNVGAPICNLPGYRGINW